MDRRNMASKNLLGGKKEKYNFGSVGIFCQLTKSMEESPFMSNHLTKQENSHLLRNLKFCYSLDTHGAGILK
jgi:hypothetical protein